MKKLLLLPVAVAALYFGAPYAKPYVFYHHKALKICQAEFPADDQKLCTAMIRDRLERQARIANSTKEKQ